ncbi:MAG: hypothetical protein LUG58_08060, partial [Clostridiales bacterium]|nr:hypothetical protein [Clostridiales bacterium]
HKTILPHLIRSLNAFALADFNGNQVCESDAVFPDIQSRLNCAQAKKTAFFIHTPVGAARGRPGNPREACGRPRAAPTKKCNFSASFSKLISLADFVARFPP